MSGTLFIHSASFRFRMGAAGMEYAISHRLVQINLLLLLQCVIMNRHTRRLGLLSQGHISASGATVQKRAIQKASVVLIAITLGMFNKRDVTF